MWEGTVHEVKVYVYRLGSGGSGEGNPEVSLQAPLWFCFTQYAVCAGSGGGIVCAGGYAVDSGPSDLQLLVCTQEEVTEHSHIDSCYEPTENLVCVPEQSNHIHGEACYEILTELTCQLEQVEDHLHAPSCFSETGERICGLISGVVHVHDDTCFKLITLDEPELICSVPEHTHEDTCYLDAEDLPHVQEDFYCNMGLHEHGADCYDDTGTLICTMPVHAHDVSCKVPAYDPQADVETPEDWEKAFKNLPFTGRCPDDLLMVAVTQLGYQESKQNVVWLEDGAVKGYTRYCAWYGAPYIDWSAAFVSFCVEYANISGRPQGTKTDVSISFIIRR